jgi:hypothetical protein
MADELYLVLAGYVIGCTIVAWIAQSQGRSPLVWFGIAVLLSPLFGFVGVILSAPRRQS